MRHTTRWALVCLLVPLAHAATAYAGTPAPDGSLELDGDARHTFDEPGALIVVQSSGQVQNGNAGLIESDEAIALEGDSYLVMGGPSRTDVLMPLGDWSDDLRGKRVRLTIWQKPRGTDARFAVAWQNVQSSNSLSGQTTQLGEIAFFPTGRVTSDAWIEMSTVAFDWELGGVIAPSMLRMTDRRFEQGIRRQNPAYDPADTVLVDALEAVVVSDAVVPDASCTLLDEETICGDHGTCLFDRCVDAASIWGAPPPEASRARWTRRLGRVFETFAGARNVAPAEVFLEQIWDELTASSVRDYWNTLARRLELSGDPHAFYPVQIRPWKSVGSGGVCLGPAEADLLPGASTDAQLMVFRESNLDNVLTQSVQVGDVLTLVDGVPWRDWIEHSPMYLFYSGDPTDGDLMRGRKLLDAALTTGADLTFERCDKPNGSACSAAEVETITIDLGEIYGEDVWAGRVVNNLQSYWCDWRFDSPVNYPRFGSRSNFYSKAVEGVRHILFQSAPSVYDDSGSWMTNMKQAMAEEPEGGFLLDMRMGLGGTPHVMDTFAAHFFAEGSPVRVDRYYPLPEGYEEAQKGLYRECRFLDVFCQHSWSTMGEDFEPFLVPDHPRYPDTPVAILAGEDVSAHDLLLYLLQKARGTPARIFGYATSQGAFGQVITSDRMLGGVRPMRVQSNDTIVTFADGTTSPYLTGTGVTPDEIIHQKQSDALAGVDTVLVRAQAWLAEQNQQGGQ